MSNGVRACTHTHRERERERVNHLQQVINSGLWAEGNYNIT